MQKLRTLADKADFVTKLGKTPKKKDEDSLIRTQNQTRPPKQNFAASSFSAVTES